MGRGQRQEKRTRPGAAAPDARHLHPHAGVRHLFAACELGEDKLYGHIKPRKTRTRFLEFCRYPRSCTRLRSGSRSSATTSART